MLAFPSKGYRSVDFPTMAYVEQYARNFKEVRERVAPLGIQCGWWFCGTVKLGHGEEEKCPVWGSAPNPASFLEKLDQNLHTGVGANRAITPKLAFKF